MKWFIQHVNISKNLRNLHEQHGHSQYKLVIRLHLMRSSMSHSAYSKIETGTRNIRIGDFLALIITKLLCCALYLHANIFYICAPIVPNKSFQLATININVTD